MIIFDILTHFPETFPILKTSISAVAAFALGILWYHPRVMGEKLEDAREAHETLYEPPAYVYLISLLMWILTSCVYSFLTGFLTPPSISALLGLSTFLWVGFILPTTLFNGMFAGKKMMVMAVDSSYFLAGLYVFAVIHDVLT